MSNVNPTVEQLVTLGTANSSDRALCRCEIAIAVIVTATSLYAHTQALLYGGPLWRDEVVSAEVANLPMIGDVWHHLQCDSFPIVWHLVLRTWTALTGGDDFTLRILGLIIGTSILGALWLFARGIPGRLPMLSVVLLGLNGAVIWYGDSIRGYGLGMLFAILAAWGTWRLVRMPSWRNTCLATFLAVLAVHCLFHNTVLVFVSCCSGAMVALVERNWRLLIQIGLVGVVAAVSLLPYYFTLASSRQWVSIVQFNIDWAWVWVRLHSAFTDSGPLALTFWTVLLVIGLAIAAAGILPWYRARLSHMQRLTMLYFGTMLLVSPISYTLFLLALSYFMQPWYFLVLLVLVAMGLEGVGSIVQVHPPYRVTRLFVVVFLSLTMVVPVLVRTRERRTNIDLVAEAIKGSAKANDVVLVAPWIYGHTFHRVYSGPAEWFTLPPLPFPHRPDELGLMGIKRQMAAPAEAMDPVLDRIHTSLSSGGRLWYVGRPLIPPEGAKISEIAPYTSSSPYREFQYRTYWSTQVGQLLRDHAMRGTKVDVPVSIRVSSYEDVPLALFEGWRP